MGNEVLERFDCEVGDRVLIARSSGDKEVARIKGVSRVGTIIVRNTEGNIYDVAPDQIIKRFPRI